MCVSSLARECPTLACVWLTLVMAGAVVDAAADEPDGVTCTCVCRTLAWVCRASEATHMRVFDTHVRVKDTHVAYTGMFAGAVVDAAADVAGGGGGHVPGVVCCLHHLQGPHQGLHPPPRLNGYSQVSRDSTFALRRSTPDFRLGGQRCWEPHNLRLPPEPLLWLKADTIYKDQIKVCPPPPRSNRVMNTR